MESKWPDAQIIWLPDDTVFVLSPDTKQRSDEYYNRNDRIIIYLMILSLLLS